jgi:hypothetical protein
MMNEETKSQNQTKTTNQGPLWSCSHLKVWLGLESSSNMCWWDWLSSTTHGTFFKATWCS